MLPVFKSLVLVGVTTVGLLILDQFLALRHVTLVYLVPVVIAATKLGIVPAVIAAIAGALSSTTAFFWAWANLTGRLPEPPVRGVERREVEVHGEPTI